MPRRVLILGGTGDAAALSAAAGAALPELDIVVSVAGRTSAARGDRVGGFGGAAGLAAYLREREIAALVDATHPFATAISANARAACAEAGVPRLQLLRPEWRAQPGDNWIETGDAAAAAAWLPALGRRAFLTVGAGSLAPFATCFGPWFLVRLVEPPPGPLALPAHAVVLGRGPFTVEDEADLMRAHDIDVLVTKASGGRATVAKLLAARARNIPVLMIRRPPPQPGETAEAVAEAVDWIRRVLG